MVKYIVSINTILLVLILSIFFPSIISINHTCNDNQVILISSKTIFLFYFDFQNDYSSSIIYQTKSNTTIEHGLFDRLTNTIFLLIKHSNEKYSILLLNHHDYVYNYWIEKSNKLIYSTYIYISLGQRHFYVLNHQTMLLQIFNLPFISTLYDEDYLLKLPKKKKIVNFVIDEKFHILWILLENIQHQLYMCQLNTYSCRLYMNIFNINKSIQFFINWKYQQMYIYSANYLSIFDYYENQTDYSIRYLNSLKQSEDQFLTICEQTNYIEYISINYSNRLQACLQTCQYSPVISDDNSRVHTIERFSMSNILGCIKQRRIIKIIVIILILMDIAVVAGFIGWLGYTYSHQLRLYKHKKQMNFESNWIKENDFVTFF